MDTRLQQLLPGHLRHVSRFLRSTSARFMPSQEGRGSAPSVLTQSARRARAGRITGWDWLQEYTQRAKCLSDGLLDALGTGALRVVGAGLEEPEPAASFDKRLAADRAGLVEDLRPLARLAVLAHVRPVLALGVARAGDERTEPARLPHEVALAALRANLVGLRRRGLLRGAEHSLERTVEVPDHRDPLLLAALDLVEPLFQLGRVVVVRDGLEVVD